MYKALQYDLRKYTHHKPTRRTVGLLTLTILHAMGHSMTPHEVANLAKQQDPPCTCDICQPQLYAKGKCNSSHAKTSLGQHYEALHLVRAATRYFSRPEIAMIDAQKSALEHFREVYQKRFGEAGGVDKPDDDWLRDVLSIFNRLFFFGALKAVIKWGSLKPNTLGHYLLQTATIEIDWDHHYTYINPAGRRTKLLATILHEAVHAFLRQLSCRKCSTYATNVNDAEGHGRAFQLLGVALKEATFNLLGSRLDVGGFNSWRLASPNRRCIPSGHDIEMWQWVKPSQAP